MDFSEFGLHPDLLDGIDALNFTTATPIQAQTIPLILAGKDVIGVAQTGTGKTAAFVLPIIHKIIESNEAHFNQALIVVPTRELAIQIEKVIEAYSYFSGVSAMAIYGGGDGKSFNQERTALTGGADIIIATPGRLISHIQLGYVNFKRVKFLVLDEADRMLDMGFQPDLLKIFETLNPQRQSLLFSATMPPNVLKLSKSLLKDPAMVSIALSKPAAGVTQGAYLVDDRQKLPLIVDLLKDKIGQRILVFGSSKQSVNQLYQKLKAKQLSVGLMSSDLEQEQREQVMMAFRNRQVDVLVATDVVSRGIDVDGIDMVINYDVPRDAEDYVHRIGRTARAARKGEALTLISPMDKLRFRKIEQLIGSEITKLPVPEHLGPASAYPEPRPGQRHGSGDHRKSSTPRGPSSSDKNKRRRPNNRGGAQKPKTEG